MEITLDVQPRTDKGKGPAGRARAAGKVPAVLYGSSVEPVSLYVDARQMGQALHTEAGTNVLLNIKVDGKAHLTVPREIHRHPIRGNLIHIDFVNVARNVKIHADVPVHLIGESHGVKEGGQMDQLIHSLSVEALPTEIPAAIEVDVSALGIGDHLTVADVKVPAGVDVLTPGDEVLVSVHMEITLDVEADLGDEAEPAEDAADEDAEQAPAEQ